MDRLVAAFKRIELKNPVLNAMVSVRAIKDLEINQPGKLSNWIVAVKDNFTTLEDQTTCASKILTGFRAPFEATVISKLKKEGAILIGKTNMDEFGMGSFTVHTNYGPTINPVDELVRRVAGGSSGGSAVAVRAGFCNMYL